MFTIEKIEHLIITQHGKIPGISNVILIRCKDYIGVIWYKRHMWRQHFFMGWLCEVCYPFSFRLTSLLQWRIYSTQPGRIACTITKAGIDAGQCSPFAWPWHWNGKCLYWSYKFLFLAKYYIFTKATWSAGEKKV